MNSTKVTRWFVYLLIIVAIVAILWSYNTTAPPTVDLSLSELAAQIKAGEVSELRVTGDGMEVAVIYKDSSQAPGRAQTGGSSLLEDLNYLGVTTADYSENGTSISYDAPSAFGPWLNIIGLFLPALIIVAFIYFIFRQAQGTNNQAMSFGKSKARMFTGDHPTVSFEDVAGADEAKEELREVVEFLKEPEKFVSFGARIPKGVLLVGHPGTGKTLLAKAVSGEAGVPFFSIAGSEFVEMFVGVGASRVRDLFDQAKRHSPCIIFVDEIDAVGRQRGAGLGGSHDEREQTLNQILVEMDGFGTDTHVIILAATNRPDILDPALMRPGRFDRRVVIDRPDIRGREAIFKVHMRGKPLASNVKTEVLARATPGFVGADIENTVNEAALLAARRNKKSIGMSEFQEAIERVQLGPERRSRIMSQEEREITAYHEAGHAIVSHMLPHALAVRKVTIIPRGMAGGATWYLEEDSYFMSQSKFRALIASALGGRIAEEIVFGEITTGASSDLRHVTQMARAMVTQYGMSETLGPRVYGDKQELVFLGREISEQRDYSDAVAEQIDREVRLIIDEQYEIANRILSEHRDKLEIVARQLLDSETLEADEFAALMEGADPAATPPAANTPPKPSEPTPSGGRIEWNRPKLDLPPAPSPA
ncbi:MAG: ATP-dependent metallopeptidase FtsH/Yme1/Tma family protein [Pseudomonadales bacterium]|nr:ATP-dependent metallopeptidase FtsH/Yme1/Tma family protein [Ardenticatenaceae bacterium]MCP5191263.1 ATP-dependent metallopeptidase FtsH/Yme1/Tma family protein [Pseudomonadales bacterium]